MANSKKKKKNNIAPKIIIVILILAVIIGVFIVFDEIPFVRNEINYYVDGKLVNTTSIGLFGKVNTDSYDEDGKIFDGWYIDSTCQEKYNPSRLLSGITLYAKTSYDRSISYKVTFKNGTDIQDITVINGDLASPIADPVDPDGYDFAGWYLNNKKYKFNSPVTSNIELIAKFKRPGEILEEEIVDDEIFLDDFSIHFMELGNEYAGDSIYIKAGETDILIDAGSRASSATVIKNYVDNYCTDGILEYVIATHGDQDHIAGFNGVKDGNSRTGIFYQYEIETIIDFKYTTKTTETYNTYKDGVDYLVSKGTKHYYACDCFNNENGAKDTYELSDYVSMKILYNKYYFEKSSDENNHSVCTLFTYDDGINVHNFMLTGDLELEGEESLANYYDGSTEEKTLPECVLFKANHHGSAYCSNDPLLEKITPKMCTVTCVAGNPEYTNNYQTIFPSQALIDRISKYTDRVYCTTMFNDETKTHESMNGTIIVSVSENEVGLWASNNLTKLKDTTWFNQIIYVVMDGSVGKISDKKGDTNFYTKNTKGAIAVPRRVWPEN